MFNVCLGEGAAVDWDALKVVLALERTGSLSGAALELGVTHPTISRKLGRLQDDLGVRLFEHTPTGWQATDEGQQLLRVARQVEVQMLNLDRTLQGRDVRLAGVLRLWTVEAFARAFRDEVGAFLARYPNITLELQAQNRVPSLARREVDVLLTFAQEPPEQLIGHMIGPIGYALYGTERLLERTGWDTHHDLERLPWLAWHHRAQARMTTRWMRQHVPGARITCTLEHSS
ncbi:MAG: LysR family transcriptional regulator, partial [Myxococcota bacterium]